MFVFIENVLKFITRRCQDSIGGRANEYDSHQLEANLRIILELLERLLRNPLEGITKRVGVALYRRVLVHGYFLLKMQGEPFGRLSVVSNHFEVTKRYSDQFGGCDVAIGCC